MLPERVFLLEETDTKVEVVAGDDATLYVHCGAVLDHASAHQLKKGLMAVLSGEFDRAVSQSEFEFDLARRTASERPRSGSAKTHTAAPELDAL